MKLEEVARALDAELHGDLSLEITGVCGIETAGPGDLTFVSNAKYAPLARTTHAGAVLVTPDFPAIPTATLRTPNPYLAFARAIGLFYQSPVYPQGIHPTAQIDPSATVGPNSHVGAYVVVMANTKVGANAVLHPHVVLYPNVTIGDDFTAHAHSIVREGCLIGNRVLLQNGVVIGADGFGFAKDSSNRWHKIPQSGPTILEDDVEVQSLTTVDRASVGQTRIGRGSKLDNLVQIGHGSSIGEDTLLCAQVGLAGSTEVGDRVILAGQVGVAGHCEIGDDAVVLAQAGVHGDVQPGKMMGGTPAIESRLWLRASAVYARLPELARRIGRKSNPD